MTAFLAGTAAALLLTAAVASFQGDWNAAAGLFCIAQFLRLAISPSIK